MILLALLLQTATAQEPPEIIVPAPARPSAQTPATIVVEPVAMFVAACDADGDGLTERYELTPCVQRSFEAIDTAKTGKLRYFAFADWALQYLGDRNALPSPFDVDKDGDNMVSLDELQAQFQKLYSRFHRSGAGIARADLLTFRTGPVDANGPTRPGLPKRGKDGKPAPADRPEGRKPR